MATRRPLGERGASLVPSPVMATMRPPAWLSRISLSFGLGSLPREVVHPASRDARP